MYKVRVAGRKSALIIYDLLESSVSVTVATDVAANSVFRATSLDGTIFR